MSDAVAEFFSTNKVVPETVIVYRDGVSDSQMKALLEMEAKAFLRAFREFEERSGITRKIALIYVCVNKKIGAKFYISGDNLQRGGVRNPPQGTIISKTVTTGKDFFMISQKTTQGSATPTHYHVIHNDLETENAERNEQIMKDIQVLSYKLCFMYYNWVGAIKIPAPIQYAHKLSNLIADRWKNKLVRPHEHFGKTRSLYFI
jgi:aubergine-like protein